MRDDGRWRDGGLSWWVFLHSLGRQYAFDMMPESGHTGVAHVAAETI
jgi:hypothetical protein